MNKSHPPVVDGGWESLLGLRVGDHVLLDLSITRLVGSLGKHKPKVDPPRCRISKTRGGVLFVDRNSFKGWTEEQIQAWRELDELEERLDMIAFESPTAYSWDNLAE